MIPGSNQGRNLETGLVCVKLFVIRPLAETSYIISPILLSRPIFGAVILLKVLYRAAYLCA